MSRVYYSQDFKITIIKLRIVKGLSLSYLSSKYKVSPPTIVKWCRDYSKINIINTNLCNMEEIRSLNKKMSNKEKENKFLLDGGAVLLVKNNRLDIYKFISKNGSKYGYRWLFSKFNISSHGYYNFLKYRKKNYDINKFKVFSMIKTIYHKNNGVVGYPTMKVLLEREGIYYSRTTLHKYMNKELHLKCMVRKRKKPYIKGEQHKIFPNLLDRNFYSSSINKKWLTDFTYLHLKNGSVRYNCTIIDLYDRSVVASITDRNITADLAIRTLDKALKSQVKPVKNLILHSDQGSQFSSKEFINYCKSKGIIQSMSKAGCPYDNAPMERYYNSLKNEYINLFTYNNEEELYRAVSYFAYVKYNNYRPHTYNKLKTPFQKRMEGLTE